MSDDPPPLTPVRQKVPWPALPRAARTALVVVLIALAGFIAGLRVSAQEVPEVRATPVPTSSASLPSPKSAVGSSTPIAPVPVAAPSLLPVNTYHLTRAEVSKLAQASRFYAAYNAGELDVIMSLLSAQPRLVDCSYVTRALVTLDDRNAIAAYLRARFADHDLWVVEFYGGNPSNPRDVVVLPLQRSSGTLRALGAPGGVKREFPVLLYLVFDSDGTHIDVIGWGTTTGGPDTVTALCTP